MQSIMILSRNLNVLLWCRVLMVGFLLLASGCGEAASVKEIITGHDTNPEPTDLRLTWTPPTTNEDGSVIYDLAGYRLYYGTASGYYEHVIDVGNFNSCVLSPAPVGTLFLAVTAYDSSGNESVFSEELMLEIL